MVNHDPMHCYRHVDRPAGVTCQRCDRPICPSCMVSASVGFHCPDCARAGASSQRLIDVHLHRTEPVLTYGLIAINVLVFVLGFVADAAIGGSYGSIFGRFSLAGGYVHSGEWWRIITSGFLHAGAIHLALNMYVLYMVGPALERSVGRLQFGLIYAVSLIGGSLGAILTTDPRAGTVGASGAIFGLFAAFAVLSLSRGQNPMQNGIGATILLNIVITFAVPGISKGGHIGGLIAGAICAVALFGLNPEQARGRARLLSALVPAVAALGIGLFVLATVSAPAFGS